MLIMNRDDDPQLWDLLGQTAEPKISPFFARNVVREVRGLRQERGKLRSWFSLRRLVPLASVAVALIAVLFLQMQSEVGRPISESDADLLLNVDPQDYEVVSDLHDVLTSEENNTLDETIFR